MSTNDTTTRRTIGQDRLPVGAVGLGCMGMSWAYGTDDDEARSRATIHRAIDVYRDQGLAPLIDTADVYGPFVNEELVGRALRGRRDEVVLATKVGLVADPVPEGAPISLRRDGRPGRIAGAAEDSLRRLGTDVIDLYQLHRIDPDVPVEETWGAMADLVDRGLVRRLGLSMVSVEEAERAHAVHPVASIQSELSLWTRDPLENGVLDWTVANDAGFLPFSPLGRGVLTGAVDPTALPATDFRTTLGRFQGAAWDENRRALAVIAEHAERLGGTAAQLALAWVLDRAANVVPIPGTTRPERFVENAGAARIALDDEARAALDGVGAAAGSNPNA